MYDNNDGKSIIILHELLLLCPPEHLHGVHVGGEKLFQVTGEGAQLLEWEEYGFQMHVPEGAISSPCDFAVKAIVAEQFQLPMASELASAVYAISASRRLHKSVKLEIQHCVIIRNEQQGHFLGFVKAQCNQPSLPYKFQYLQVPFPTRGCVPSLFLLWGY